MIELRLPLSRRLSAINPPRLYIARLSFIDRINNEIASGSPDFLSREGRRRRRIKREARKGKKGEEIGKERVTTAIRYPVSSRLCEVPRRKLLPPRL